LNARYIYDGDGNMVKSIVSSTLGNTTTTYYPGRHYTKEISGSTEKISHAVRLQRKYYIAGTTTIAMRTISGGTDTVNWLLNDQVNSTSVTATPRATLCPVKVNETFEPVE
jgi:hypothetical protein